MIGNEVMDRLAPICTDWIMCGGIRREKSMVHDVDILIMSKGYDIGSMETMVITELAAKDPKRNRGHPMKEKKANFVYDGVPVEIYFAMDERQFEVMKLIRTGSHEFNKMLLGKAHGADMTIKFSHDKHFGDLYGLYAGKMMMMHNNRTGANGSKSAVFVVNPLRLVAWREKDILEHIMGHWVDPKDRN